MSPVGPLEGPMTLLEGGSGPMVGWEEPDVLLDDCEVEVVAAGLEPKSKLSLELLQVDTLSRRLFRSPELTLEENYQNMMVKCTSLLLQKKLPAIDNLTVRHGQLPNFECLYSKPEKV